MTISTLSDTIKLPGLVEPVPTQLITHLEGYGNYTRVYMHRQPTPLTITQTLKWFEYQLPNFIRTHKSQLINQHYIVSIHQGTTRQVQLKLRDGSQVFVSRRRIEEVLSKLDALAGSPY